MKYWEFTSSQWAQIQDLLEDSSLRFFASEDWGSDIHDYRQKIHAHLHSQKDVVDSSISHTKGLGGYIISQKNKSQIGLDIELANRVTDSLARRICQKAEEFELAPSAAQLWTAKEAAYKALKGVWQPSVISEITIDGWKEVSIGDSSRFETFCLKDSQNYNLIVAKGISVSQSGFVFSFFSSCHSNST